VAEIAHKEIANDRSVCESDTFVGICILSGTVNLPIMSTNGLTNAQFY